MDRQSESRVRRGRPPNSSIQARILEGLNSNSQIKCPECSRDFPRNKSLQAHIRIHTGETPYKCDYPGCIAEFKQSGQLRSHCYRHTGEKPYICPACRKRYIHSNRHCDGHKANLVKDGMETLLRGWENLPVNERDWFLRYIEKKARRSSKVSIKRPLSSIHSSEESSNQDASRDSSLVPVTNSESSGYSSFSGSDQSSSPVHYEVHEETNSESFAESPKRRRISNPVIDLNGINAAEDLNGINAAEDPSVINAAETLLLFKRKCFNMQ